MNFIAAGLTDVGLQREHNEDSYCILSDQRLFLVADGMGGHRAGDIASRMATYAISRFFAYYQGARKLWPFGYETTLSEEENRLITGIKIANQRIFEASVRHVEVQGMGTTIVGALLAKDQGQMYIAHVGDSRAYRVRDGQIELLTRDHSLVNDYLLIMPHLTEAQRSELPSNVITRALGMQQGVSVDLRRDAAQEGDIYVLCSDGLNGMVDDNTIREVVQEAGEDVETATLRLVQDANKNGGEDNITVLVVRITD